MSNSVRPHRRQLTRLPHLWDSPGKNTRVGCHLLLQCMRVKSEREVAQWCQTLRNPMDCSLPGSSVHGILQARVLEWGAIAFSVSPHGEYQITENSVPNIMELALQLTKTRNYDRTHGSCNVKKIFKGPVPCRGNSDLPWWTGRREEASELSLQRLLVKKGEKCFREGARLSKSRLRKRPLSLPNGILDVAAESGQLEHPSSEIWKAVTSLVVQWLRIRLAMQGTRFQSLVGELRSHMPWSN